jgi:hypothetical protein
MVLTLVVYDERGWARFCSPLLIAVAETPRSASLVAAWPFRERFSAHSFAILDDAGDVVATGTLGSPIDEGDTRNLTISSL